FGYCHCKDSLCTLIRIHSTVGVAREKPLSQFSFLNCGGLMEVHGKMCNVFQPLFFSANVIFSTANNTLT
ncbi:unnamed protein product, partial [Musa textilis]